jgi:DNA-binding transcriptional regulator LsrR (DeoR family)
MRKGERPKPMADLVREFGHDEPWVARQIISAFRDGLVDIEVIRRPNIVRVPELEGILVAKYNLSSAIVVASTGIPVKVKSDRPKVIDLSSDELHRKLGYALANHIGGPNAGGYFRDDDTIAFGSGRGVFYTCKSIAWELPHRSLRVKGLKLVSLTGAVHARDHEGRLNARLDADFHCGLFGMCVDDSATLRLISHPIAHEPEQVQAMKRQTWLGEWDNALGDPKRIPDLALVGVGVLAEGHRFYEQAKAPNDTRDPILEPLMVPLAALVEICDTIPPEADYCPVADICNMLFFVDPPPGLKVDRAKVQELIGEINMRLLNVNDGQLSRIRQIILCAAARKKVRAIRQLLTSEHYRIKHLCTDDSVARALVGND